MIGKNAKMRLKRKGQVGRPRKEEAERFPSGQIKPQWTAQEAREVALDARKRMHGDNMNEGQLSGSTLGRIRMDGLISEDHFKAGEAYAEAIARYHRLTGVPFPSAKAQSLFSVRGHEGEISQDQATRARQASDKAAELNTMLMRCQDGPQVRGVVYGVCVMDYEQMRKLPGQSVVWLRRGLKLLHENGGLAKSQMA